MILADITARGDPVGRVTVEDLAQLRGVLGCSLPSGYDEFMLALGEGLLGGSYVRVYPPWRMLDELQEWRKRIAEFWFWSGIEQTWALEGVRLGDTLDGDELVFHPGAPDEIWVLPRESNRALRSGRGLWEALEWLCSSGVLTEAFSERVFEPFDSRTKEVVGGVPRKNHGSG